MHLHHVVPVEDGGEDTEDNLVALCWLCHHEWHAVESSILSFEDWLAAPVARFLIDLYLRGALPQEVTDGWELLKSCNAEADELARAA